MDQEGPDSDFSAVGRLSDGRVTVSTEHGEVTASFAADPTIRPDASAGYAACEAASTATPAEGNVGALRRLAQQSAFWTSVAAAPALLVLVLRIATVW